MRRATAEVEVLIVVFAETSSESSFVCSQPMGAKVLGKTSVEPKRPLSLRRSSRHPLARCICQRPILRLKQGYFEKAKTAEHSSFFGLRSEPGSGSR